MDPNSKPKTLDPGTSKPSTLNPRPSTRWSFNATSGVGSVTLDCSYRPILFRDVQDGDDEARQLVMVRERLSLSLSLSPPAQSSPRQGVGGT